METAPPDFAAPSIVAELPGLYGSFSFPEKLLQKIWLNGDFARALAVTTCGAPVRIGHPGKWNLLGGPDFTGARLVFGDAASTREVRGDVEVHLRAHDWEAHKHAADPAYDGVVLHVVLFPPPPGWITRGAGGRELPILPLLPLLHRGLEEFAADEAVEVLANRPLARLPEELGRLPAAEVAAWLQRHADERWQQKVRFAGVRLAKLGWEAACHHAALEILGFRFNRAPMLRIAGRRPLADWTNGEVEPDDEFAAEMNGWSLQGVRPANHPRRRLRQYCAWTVARPDWPERVLAWGRTLPRIDPAMTTTRDVRRAHAFAAWRDQLADALGAHVIGGNRLDTLVCDGVLPLLAAHTGVEYGAVWRHWFPGDLPAWLTIGLRQLGYFDGHARPAAHGVAQGLLGWLLARELPR